LRSLKGFIPQVTPPNSPNSSTSRHRKHFTNKDNTLIDSKDILNDNISYDKIITSELCYVDNDDNTKVPIYSDPYQPKVQKSLPQLSINYEPIISDYNIIDDSDDVDSSINGSPINGSPINADRKDVNDDNDEKGGTYRKTNFPHKTRYG